MGANAYSLAHFPLIAGTIYVALGVEQVLAGLAHEESHDTSNWISASALFGGTATRARCPVRECLTAGREAFADQGGGGCGIRTHEDIAALPVFKTSAIGH